MNVQLLVDDIIRQTTVLIAQLSTAAGLRAPLSHIADQVFLELSRELEAQGVRRKVVADMFGLALRSYQLKVQRVADGAGASSSLWQAVYADLAQGSRRRVELEQRHRPHLPQQIAASLQDMVQSGLAYSSGRGGNTIYGLTSDADRRQMTDAERGEALRSLAWYLVASGSAQTTEQLAQQLKLDDATLAELLRALRDEGRVSQDEGQLLAQPFEIAVGSSLGWETAVLDHFRAVATAIGMKVSRPYSAKGDRVGGGTHSFRVHPEHPHADEVYGLLQEIRERTAELWRRVSEHNQAHPPPEDADRVTFYFGQSLVSSDDHKSKEQDEA